MNFFFVQEIELQNSRWDTNYWRPDLLVIINQIEKFKTEVISIGEVAEVSNGKAGSRNFINEKEVQYLVISNLLKTGVNLKKRPRFIKEDGSNDPKRSRVETGDILIPISGTGSIEKSTLVQDLDIKANISQDIARIRLDKNIYSTALFLQSKWGVAQILRAEAGTGVTHISLEDIKKILIPILPDDIEEWAKNSLIELNDIHNDYVNRPNGEKKRFLESQRLKLIEAFERKCLLHMKK